MLTGTFGVPVTNTGPSKVTWREILLFRTTRPLEFSSKGLPLTEILARIEQLEATIPDLVAALTESQMEAPYPENVLGEPMSTRRFLLHLHGHLQYHTGQVNYLRRIITA